MRPPWMSRSCTTSARRVYDFSTLGYIGIQCRNPANIWVRYYTNWTASTSAIDEQVILINSGYFNNMNPRVKIIRTTCGRDPTDNIIYSRHHGPARARRSLGAALGLLAALTLKRLLAKRSRAMDTTQSIICESGMIRFPLLVSPLHCRTLCDVYRRCQEPRARPPPGRC